MCSKNSNRSDKSKKKEKKKEIHIPDYIFPEVRSTFWLRHYNDFRAYVTFFVRYATTVAYTGIILACRVVFNYLHENLLINFNLFIYNYIPI